MRYLGLTARRNDNEFHAQQISQQRLQISTKMQDIATAYTTGMNNRLLQYKDPLTGDLKALTYDIITDTTDGLGYKVYTADGKEVVPSKEAIEDPAEVRKNAQAKYDAVMTKKSLVFNEDAGELKGTVVDGASFLAYYMPDEATAGLNAVKDKNGTIVNLDVDAFKKTVQNLDAEEFYKYWHENGLSLVNGNNPVEGDNAGELAAAKLEYDDEMARADEIAATRYFADKDCLDPKYLEDKLRNGDWFLNKVGADNTRLNVSWSEVSAIFDNLDTSDDAAVASEYESQSAFWQQKDKELELEIKQLETEHNALQTEIDSVKKVINDNVEKSFKTFSA